MMQCLAERFTPMAATGHALSAWARWASPRWLARLTAFVAVEAAMFLVATPSQAQTYRQITADQLERVMKAEGYAVRRDSDGDIVWTNDGLRWLVLVQGDGTSIQVRFAVGDSRASLERINEWNRTKRFSKSYLDRDGDPILALDLDLAGGVEKARILDFLRTATLSRTTWIKEVFDR